MKARGSLWIALLLVIFLAGCGSSHSTSGEAQACAGLTGSEYAVCAGAHNAAQVAGAESSSTEEASAPAGSEVLSMPIVATLHLRSEEGYTARAELRRGKPMRAMAGMQNGGLVLGSACEVNDKTDAVEPFELTLTNTTSRLSASPAINVVARTSHSELPGVSAELNYTERPQCVELTGDAYPGDENTNGQDYVADSPTTPLEPGESSSTTGFFIIANYYSPARPHGDPAKISATVLELDPQAGGENFAVKSASGVLHSESLGDAVPMLPGGNGGCLAHPPCPPLFRTE